MQYNYENFLRTNCNKKGIRQASRPEHRIKKKKKKDRDVASLIFLPPSSHAERSVTYIPPESK